MVLYFFGYTDKKIGEMHGKSRTTVNYWKIAALKQLKKKWRDWSMKNRKMVSFEVVEKAVYRRAESYKRCLVPLQRIHKISIGISRTF